MYTDPGKTHVEAEGTIEKHVVFKYLDIFYNNKEHIVELKARYIK
jgi:tryptophanyl-tRNA synthetase